VEKKTGEKGGGPGIPYSIEQGGGILKGEISKEGKKYWGGGEKC